MWRTPLTGYRVPISDICRHFAFSAFLEHTRPSKGLSTTITWDCVLVLASHFAAVLPATRTMVRKGSRSIGRRGDALPISGSDQHLTTPSKPPNSQSSSQPLTHSPPLRPLAPSSTSVSGGMRDATDLREFA
jgi:hypothetical protein